MLSVRSDVGRLRRVQVQESGTEVAVYVPDMMPGEAELDIDAGGRNCVFLQANELFRARGGPHRLSHALERDPLN